MRLTTVLALLANFLCLPVVLHGQCGEAFKRPVPQRYFYIDSFFSQTERDTLSILQILACREEAISRKEYETAIFLDMRHYLVYRESGTHQEKMEGMLESMLSRALELKDHYLLVSVYMQHAWWQFQYGTPGIGLVDYLRAYEIFKTLSLQEFPRKNYPLYLIALSFYQYDDYAKALEIAGHIEKPISEPFHHTLSANLIGMCYLKTEKYDSARYWFNEAIRVDIGRQDLQRAWQGITDGNIGHTWYLQQEYDKAIPFLQSGVEKTAAEHVFDNTAGFECILADIYLSKGQHEIAWRYLESARDHTYSARKDDNFFKLYKALSQYYRKAGDPARTLMYQDSMLIYADILEAKKDKNQKVQAEYTFANEQYLAASASLMAKTRHQKGIRNLIIGILFLLMLIVVLFYLKQRNQYQFKSQQMEFEKRKAEETLRSAQTELDDFTQMLKEKNALIEQFSEEMQKLHGSTNAPLTTEQAEILNQLRQSAILTDRHWEEFRARFEKVHVGYLHRLKQKLPDLHPAEIRFMVLAKLQLTNREMAGILNVSTDSVRMMRLRLRRKLNLEEEGSLEELINSI